MSWPSQRRAKVRCRRSESMERLFLAEGVQEQFGLLGGYAFLFKHLQDRHALFVARPFAAGRSTTFGGGTEAKVAHETTHVKREVVVGAALSGRRAVWPARRAGRTWGPRRARGAGAAEAFLEVGPWAEFLAKVEAAHRLVDGAI